MHQSGAIPCVISDQVGFSTPKESAGSADLTKTAQGEDCCCIVKKSLKTRQAYLLGVLHDGFPTTGRGHKIQDDPWKLGSLACWNLIARRCRLAHKHVCRPAHKPDFRRHSHIAQFLCFRVKFLNPIVGISKKWGAFLHCIDTCGNP